MKLSILQGILLIGASLLSCCAYGQKSPTMSSKPSFPFLLKDMGGGYVVVFVAPEYYNKNNLEQLFLWHHQNHLKSRNLQSDVFTDKQRMNEFLEKWEKSKPTFMNTSVAGERIHTDAMVVTPNQRTPWDAQCLRVTSDPLLEKNADPTSKGFDLSYRYAPDLNQPNITKTVILRGSTWTEGKFNLQTQEVSDRTSKIIITAYDLYNVEPFSRYYTFSWQTAKNNYLQTRIIFNIRQDEVVQPPINQVKILNDSIVFVYMGWMYSVTTNGGGTWQLWDAEKDLPNWHCCDPSLIQRVEIHLDGSGTMALKPNPQRLGEVLTLHTKDFGQHWAK